MKYIEENMNYDDMMICLSGNLKNSYEVLKRLKKIDRFYMILRELDYFDIIGDKIYKLFHFCCDDNIYNLDETMMLFRFGAFSKEEILDNLRKENPISFLDKDIFYYVDYENRNNNEGQEKFDDYILRLRLSFIERKDNQDKNLELTL